MAEIVEGTFKGRMGRPPIYPWEKWVEATIDDDEKFITCTQGIDFNVTIFSFQNTIHRHARAYKLKAKTSACGKVVSFRFNRITQMSPQLEATPQQSSLDS